MSVTILGFVSNVKVAPENKLTIKKITWKRKQDNGNIPITFGIESNEVIKRSKADFIDTTKKWLSSSV